jgi:peptide/nickel transport system substrate-binding protein
MTSKHLLHLAAALVASTACTLAAAQTTIVVAQPADIRSTNPGTNRDNTTDGVMLHMVEGLVGYKEDGSVGPLLAQSIEVSKDGLTYTFPLRRNVKFHNGAALTSADVAWNWKRYMDPATEWRCLSEFDGRSGIKVVETKAPDPYTFVMRLEKPSAIFLDTLARTDCASAGILHSSSLKADGSWDKPVGTGPFKFGEWQRGRYITLTAFKDYVSPPGSKADGYIGLKKPLVDNIKFVVVPDPSSAKAGVQSGGIDVAQVTESDAKELKNDKNVTPFTTPLTSKNVLLFNTRDPLLKNEKLRLAIAASLDIPQLVETAGEGFSKPNPSAVQALSSYYSAIHKKGYTYDPTRVRKLLQEAGYKGEMLKIQTNKRTTVPSFKVAVLAQAMMQAAGINSEIEVIEWATHLDRYNKGNYQISSFSYSSRLDPALSYEQFSGNRDKQPRKVWEDPKALQLIDESMVESDPAKRQAMFDQLHTLMLAQAPLIILDNGVDSWATHKRVSGFTAWESKPRLWNTRVAR